MKYIVIGTDLNMFEVESKERAQEVLAAFMLDPFRRMTDISALDEIGGSVLVTEADSNYQGFDPVVRVIRIA